MYKYPIAKPLMGMPEKENLVKCITDGWVTAGNFVTDFEDQMALYCHREHGCAVSSGTAALHLALKACGIGEGSQVLVPSLTYIATVNAILQCGATPVYVDSRLSDWQMNEEDAIQVMDRLNIDAVLAVHLYGIPCDIIALEDACKRKGIYLIEDCAEALGAMVSGIPIGSFGHVSCFSFFGNKTITTGEGGMVLTDTASIKESVNHLKSHATVKTGRAYCHDALGYNYRMSDLQAAVGCAQMGRIDHILKRKEEICNLYTKTIFREFVDHCTSLKGGVKTVRLRRRGITSGYWLYSLVAETKELRDGLLKHLESKSIEPRPFFSPIHTMPHAPGRYAGDLGCPVASSLGDRGLNLPTYQSMTDEDVKYISRQVLDYLRNNVR